MKKAPSRKPTKKAAVKGSNKIQEKAKRTPSASPEPEIVQCAYCEKKLTVKDSALFVEEEVGRVFCSEGCITHFFSPDVERLEEEFYRIVPPDDLTPKQREKHANLKWNTLDEPDEVWVEKTIAGDYRYTLISEFQPENKPIWCICITLMLRSEPSFLFLSFVTRKHQVVEQYQRGERTEIVKAQKNTQTQTGEGETPSTTDRLADPWTEEETFRAQLSEKRREDDIPVEEYEQYQDCVDETLESPDEVWSLEMGEKGKRNKLYHFLKHYPDRKPSAWFVIVAKDVEDEEQMEILDAFPTRDNELLDSYRRGKQEVGQSKVQVVGRIVH